MLVAASIIPSAPLLVPELAGAAAETADLREAVLSAAAALPQTWIAVGVGARDEVWGPDAAGTFAGYGVDVEVMLGPEATTQAELPLCALVTGWVRGQVRPDARARVHAVTTAPGALLRVRADIDSHDEPVGLLVVADGCNTLTPSAPGGHDPDATGVQAALDDALCSADTAALSALPDGVVGRAAFAVLAGLMPTPRSVGEFYRGAPFGVGYTVCVWQP
ncbi:hypothetical protein BVC93_29730 [Mycobacterium sp. MS1601]|uniref:hypothetical protein n=1 Tax=Mycobacterium sp. MS1601 TaxID=1936029 RepID=UPI0009795069|nr:hypothetical protein [Mycobacterium sp. MS1601]AQA05853.1 hypothetical protein BVC93_29730 [Mycobacterium sp. MS1601]